LQLNGPDIVVPQMRLLMPDWPLAGAVESADFLGQRKVQQTTRGFSGGMPSRTYTSVEEHKIKPYELRHLKKHQCVLVHCERGFKRTVLAPLEPGGEISSWYKGNWL
jgi:hypothetical protein